jgi:hypothetical protein
MNLIKWTRNQEVSWVHLSARIRKLWNCSRILSVNIKSRKLEWIYFILSMPSIKANLQEDQIKLGHSFSKMVYRMEIFKRYTTQITVRPTTLISNIFIVILNNIRFNIMPILYDCRNYLWNNTSESVINTDTNIYRERTAKNKSEKWVYSELKYHFQKCLTLQLVGTFTAVITPHPRKHNYLIITSDEEKYIKAFHHKNRHRVCSSDICVVY